MFHNIIIKIKLLCTHEVITDMEEFINANTLYK